MNNWKNHKIFVNYFTWKEAIDNTPKGYKLPEKSDFQELIDSTIYTWDEEDCNGIFTFEDGFKLVLPAMGYRDVTSITIYDRGSYGYYWSASPYASGDYSAESLHFESANVNMYCNFRRAHGASAIYIKI